MSWRRILCFALFVGLTQCKPRSDTSSLASVSKTAVNAGTCGEAAICGLPVILTVEQIADVEKAVRTKLGTKVDAELIDRMAPKIAHYMGFLGIPVVERKKNAKGDYVDGTFEKTLSRILESSTQFLVCESLEDWACLQEDPALAPRPTVRQATEPGLGAPVDAGPSLDMDFMFTQRFDSKQKWSKNEPVKTMSYALANIINDPSHKRISMAAYGIRSIGPDESMYPVFKAIADRVKKRVDVRAVLDQVGQYQPEDENYVFFTYPEPKKKDFGTFFWAFAKPDPLNVKRKEKVEESEEEEGEEETSAAEPSQWIEYTYANTPDLIALLNKGIETNEEAKARLEWPSAGIMHNKFLVFEDGQGPRAVWTGTTNLSDSCMGEEKNSNLGVLIRNRAIAATYRTEFDEMFEYQVNNGEDSSSAEGEMQVKNIVNPFPVGRFHRNKRPNTHRYFTMGDGTELTVHFSPTDDAEHRSILPVLLSARQGDTVRISMFGNSGIDYVRAIQYAVAKGAHVKLLMDYEQGAGSYSWVGKKAPARLQEPNPFPATEGSPGTLEIRKGGKGNNPTNGWLGKNHHKSATLTREDGTVEYFLTGSQNWSVGGNDKNDENMISIRNRRGVVTTGKRMDKEAAGPVKVGNEFNDEFDQHMWIAAGPAKLR